MNDTKRSILTGSNLFAQIDFHPKAILKNPVTNITDQNTTST